MERDAQSPQEPQDRDGRRARPRRSRVIGGGAAIAAGGDDDASDAPITGAALARAKAAALAHTGGGKVTETEVGDEESLYEVEVTLPDGSHVDVQLDERFQVVGSEETATTTRETASRRRNRLRRRERRGGVLPHCGGVLPASASLPLVRAPHGRSSGDRA